MNEITNALKVANTAVRAVKAIDVAKKAVIAAAAVSCGFLMIRFFRNQKG
jgi:hypothetical protein